MTAARDAAMIEKKCPLLCALLEMTGMKFTADMIGFGASPPRARTLTRASGLNGTKLVTNLHCTVSTTRYDRGLCLSQ
ncbi:hypothetical protein CQ012_06465 [Arthrobacter sp. MYb214]|nr:hypothetical protein CQ012_06465 [Arthrobacter sp. MYb214]